MAFLDYHLPPELIAQSPAPERDQSRLLVLRRSDQSIEHRIFSDLPELLAPGDLLVLNDTRVVPARLIGQREKTSGKWEGLYLAESLSSAGREWQMLCQTRGTLVPGEAVLIGPLRLIYLGRTDDKLFRFRPESEESTTALLDRVGQIPLPPYIRKGLAGESDRDRYQTVYARDPGSVAAPTAGLHFSERLFSRLAERGIERTQVTLHVGLGTFQSLQSDDPNQHVMHSEWCELSAQTAAALNAARARGSRIVAVGTTAVRTLETAKLSPFRGETNLYIHEPYRFSSVDALITNFHLPRTSLLLLVGALAGEPLLRRGYEAAVAERYRFYSYGDAMLVL